VTESADIEALIVDLDGVIRHWDMAHFRETARSFGIEPDDFAAIAFQKELLDAGMIGTISFGEWADEIGRRCSERHGCDAATVTAAFWALKWHVDWEVVELLRAVRAAGRAKLALFSNASTRLEEDLASVDLHVEFDVVFNSARLGLAKPDPQAFRTVASQLDVPPERCLFVDDTIPNVDGARQADMQAEAFVGVAQLRSLLEQAGLVGESSAP
jgi:putative hydrolase of the HAD superfamily